MTTSPVLDDQPMTRDLNAILEAPVFVVGAPRSGTTWVQRMLLGHPAICGGQESHFFDVLGSPLLASFQAIGGPNRDVGLACYWERPALVDRIADLWRQTFRDLVERTPTATVLLEKSPGHARQLPLIAEVLPGARFIHVIRDSRSVVASLLAAGRADWGQSWAPKRARDAAVTWWQHVHDARRAAAELAKPYLEVHYEDLRRDPAAGLARLFAFIGVACPAEQIDQIVAEQDFQRQKQLGGTPLARTGDAAHNPAAEPRGFFRGGAIDSWRRELTLAEKLVTWRFTRRMMWECGYTWTGRQP
jgi:hypothetical protein